METHSCFCILDKYQNNYFLSSDLPWNGAVCGHPVFKLYQHCKQEQKFVVGGKSS